MKGSKSYFYKPILLMSLLFTTSATYSQEPDVCGDEIVTGLSEWGVDDDDNGKDDDDKGYPLIVNQWPYGGENNDVLIDMVPGPDTNGDGVADGYMLFGLSTSEDKIEEVLAPCPGYISGECMANWLMYVADDGTVISQTIFPRGSYGAFVLGKILAGYTTTTVGTYLFSISGSTYNPHIGLFSGGAGCAIELDYNPGTKTITLTSPMYFTLNSKYILATIQNSSGNYISVGQDGTGSPGCSMDRMPNICYLAEYNSDGTLVGESKRICDFCSVCFASSYNDVLENSGYYIILGNKIESGATYIASNRPFISKINISDLDSRATDISLFDRRGGPKDEPDDIADNPARNEGSLVKIIFHNGYYYVIGSLNSYTYVSETGVKTDYGYGLKDIYVAKLDASTFEIIDDAIYGGSGDDKATDIKPTADGGFILTGSTQSNDWKTGTQYHHGHSDIFILKIGSAGLSDYQWARILGGPDDESASSVLGYPSDYSVVWQRPDETFFLASSTQSNSNNVAGNHGGFDYWLLELAPPAPLYYIDADGDGYGTGTAIRSCTVPATGHVLNDDDCDDSDARVHPGALEKCNGKDNDCDGFGGISDVVIAAGGGSSPDRCVPEIVPLNITTSVAGLSFVTYQWYKNGHRILPRRGGRGATFNARASGEYHVEGFYKVTDASGAIEKGCRYKSNTLTLSFHKPTASLTPTTGSLAAAGGSINVAVIYPSGPILNYTWYRVAPPGTFTPYVSSTGRSFDGASSATIDRPGRYTVVIEDPYGCTSSLFPVIIRP